MANLVKAPPRALAQVATTEDARAQLAAARARLAKQLDDVHRALTPVTHWQDVVKKHPLITIGGAFLIGFALSKLFSRK
jgi:ElaB/YqjD/DUF883 family membrane-anchored ribosome-binding protein